MTASDSTPSAPHGEGIVCPKCRQPAGDVQRPRAGVLEFKCNACGHQWWLFDRSPEEESDR
jgi:hypothetical protein